MLLLYFFYSRDRFPEPWPVVWRTFWLGVAAVVPVLLVAVPLMMIVDGLADPYLAAAGLGFLAAALPEEGLKLLVLLVFVARYSDFDEPMDGIVYGAAASLGFATCENVLYVADGGMGVAVMRALTAVPMHAALGAILGAAVGLARFRNAGDRALIAKGFVAAVLLHGAYDFFLIAYSTLAAKNPSTASPLWVVAALGVLLVTCRLALRLARTEQQLQERPGGTWRWLRSRHRRGPERDAAG